MFVTCGCANPSIFTVGIYYLDFHWNSCYIF